MRCVTGGLGRLSGRGVAGPVCCAVRCVTGGLGRLSGRGVAGPVCCAVLRVTGGLGRSSLRPAGGGGDPGRSAGRLSARVLQHRRAGRPPVPGRAGTQRAALPPVPVRHGQLGILAKLAAPAGETAAATNTPGCRLMQVMFK